MSQGVQGGNATANFPALLFLKTIMTQSEYDQRFQEMLDRGFQPGDVAIVDDDVGETVAPRLHHDRMHVRVQLDSLIDLANGPKWIINRFFYRGALVCFIKANQSIPLKKVLCVHRNDKSAWVEIVE